MVAKDIRDPQRATVNPLMLAPARGRKVTSRVVGWRLPFSEGQWSGGTTKLFSYVPFQSPKPAAASLETSIRKRGIAIMGNRGYDTRYRSRFHHCAMAGRAIGNPRDC